MAKFHFVEDYEKYVDFLLKKFPVDEAMSLAVGGDYDRIGGIERDILRHYRLENGHSVVDFGCGSGRLAVQLAQDYEIEYLGIDVVTKLLDYARRRTPSHYKFVKNTTLTMPCADASVDLFTGFSIFTHLLHAECYIYLSEMHRALKPGGRVIASFLEFAQPAHWSIFEATVAQQRKSVTPHLNTFVERNVWEAWAHHGGFELVEFLDATAAPWPSGEGLGQSLVVLRKPA